MPTVVPSGGAQLRRGVRAQTMSPIEHICNPLIEFYGGNVPALRLVLDSEMEDAPGAPTTEAVASVVRAKPEAVAGWLRWSDDKRVSSGWCLLQQNRSYVVRSVQKASASCFIMPLPRAPSSL